jgi:hypothetical protein
LFAGVDKGGMHTELAHVCKHDAVVSGIECSLLVRVDDVDVLFVQFGVLHHHDEGGQSVVDAALVAKSVLLVAEDAVGFCVF